MRLRHKGEWRGSVPQRNDARQEKPVRSLSHLTSVAALAAVLVGGSVIASAAPALANHTRQHTCEQAGGIFTAGANAAQDRLARLQTELAQERGRINTLTANIAHLEDPENMRALASVHLGFAPVRPSQEVTLADLAAARAARARAGGAGPPPAATAGFARTATGGAPRP
jgi:TolA-binding protein